MWRLYIARAGSSFGVTHTRDLYNQAVEALPDGDALVFCGTFAKLERQLGEIDRARAIYAHGAQLADPRTSAEYWSTWQEFEVQHGNEDTYREMLRIKRSVAASYNTSVNFAASMTAAEGTTADAADAADDMAALEAEANELTKKKLAGGFVKEGGEAYVAPGDRNADEIDIDEDDEEDEEDEGEAAETAAPMDGVAQRMIPDEVYGGLAAGEGGAKEG